MYMNFKYLSLIANFFRVCCCVYTRTHYLMFLQCIYKVKSLINRFEIILSFIKTCNYLVMFKILLNLFK